jgi:hypothetical protein
MSKGERKRIGEDERDFSVMKEGNRERRSLDIERVGHNERKWEEDKHQ